MCVHIHTDIQTVTHTHTDTQKAVKAPMWAWEFRGDGLRPMRPARQTAGLYVCRHVHTAGVGNSP